MKTRRFPALFLALITLFSLLALTSCGVDGTYYRYTESGLDREDYLELKNGKWTDGNRSGTYQISDDSIKFYTETSGKTKVLMEGTVKDGVIHITILGMEFYYCREGKTPSFDTDAESPKLVGTLLP